MRSRGASRTLQACASMSDWRRGTCRASPTTNTSRTGGEMTDTHRAADASSPELDDLHLILGEMAKLAEQLEASSVPLLKREGALVASLVAQALELFGPIGDAG